MRTGSRGFTGLAVVTVLVLGACARAVVTTPPVPLRMGAEEMGLASWYGNRHHGRRTASGEVFDMNDFTCAHRSLPLGTRLMVTNLDNGQVVEVRVNDRGPFVDGRIVDLSYSAARALGAVGSGVIRVRLRIIGLPKPAPAGSGIESPRRGYSVQLGAFASRASAESLREAVERDGGGATVSAAPVGGEAYYRVQVGPYADRLAAEAGAQRLAARGYLAVLVNPD